MRINGISIKSHPGINYSLNNYQRQPFISSNADEVNFGMRVDYGIPAKLEKSLQNKILNINENIDLIQEFFKRYTVKNPQLGAKIKKGYSDLIPKRQSGIVFKLPDSDNTIEIMRGQKRKNILYISIDDGSSDFKGIIIDDNKLIANYLKRHPHMLPAVIKYMNAERMKNANPERFINIADEKLQNYGDYIRKLQSGEIPIPKLTKTAEEKTKSVGKLTKIVDRSTIAKHRKTEATSALKNAKFEDYIIKKSKNIISKITKLLNCDVKDFPEHLTPKLAPSGKPLGFTLQTDDGGTLKVMRKAVGSYGSSMPYLSFEKSNPDGTFNFISIDMISNKILRTKDRGKPHISSDHIVYDLNNDEIKKRKIEDKLDYYMNQIFKKEIKPVVKDNASVSKQVNEPEILPAVTKEESAKSEAEGLIPNDNLEKLKQEMRELGRKNGSIAATEYFNSFKEQFVLEVQQKMAEFSSEFQKFIESLSK